jgi:hypothetical protein
LKLTRSTTTDVPLDAAFFVPVHANVTVCCPSGRVGLVHNTTFPVRFAL